MSGRRPIVSASTAPAALSSALLLSLVLASCHRPLTEIVVVVTSDVSASVSSVSFRVTGPNGEQLESSVPRDGAPLEWPLTLSLTRSSPPHRPLTVEVSGAATIGTERVQLDRTVVTGFVPDERRLLAIRLDAACDEPCMDEIEPGDLPPFTGSLQCLAEDLGSSVGTFHRILDRDTSRPASCVSTAGHDLAFSWRAPRSGRFVIDSLPGSDADTVIEVLAGCDGPSLACHDDVDADRLWSRVELDLEAGESILVYVYGFWDDVPVDLTILPAPLPDESCTNGEDDDRDGATDCADPACDTDAACTT